MVKGTGFKKHGVEVTFSGLPSLLNFMKIYQMILLPSFNFV
jgi:hypothetical protein